MSIVWHKVTKCCGNAIVAIVFLCVMLSSIVRAADDGSDAASAKFFEREIRPLLLAKCVKCHGAKKQEGKLRLDSRAAMLQGGESGPAVVPRKVADSLLIDAINYGELEMPPTGQLAPREIERLVRWVAGGAVWPEQAGPLRAATAAVTAADRQWWAFQPLHKQEVPESPSDNWSTTPIDRFVLRRLQEHGMQPAPRASKQVLVRRLYFDLVGLPPTPAEIDDFVNDKSPAAWEHLIDKLLDDKRYGEHWARFWLDIVRYAESDGWNQDAYRPDIWRYRDYVVDAFNEDKPYPDFVREQLAGDEIGGDNPEHLAAAGFLRLGIYEYNQRDARGHWNDIMNELTDTVGDVFFGMGMACTRCHDHKFDPLYQVDYFKLRAFFEPIIWRDDLVAATQAERQAYQRQLAVWEDATRDIRGRIDTLLKPYNDRKWKSTAEKFPLDIQACFFKPVAERTSWEQQMAYLISRQFLEEGGGPLKSMSKEDRAKYDTLKKELAKFDQLKPKPLPRVMTAKDFAGELSPTTIPDDPAQSPIAPGFLSVLEDDSASQQLEVPKIQGSSGRRTALAAWIGRPDNPLTTRVIVNRVWQQHFGQGIVPTANDFGHMGQPPTHPQLLDWLTVTFVENGWSLKKLHKLILRSAVWQQSAQHPQANSYQQQDPSENLLWRARIRRLTAEQIRDAMLSVSGELQSQIGGPSVDGSVPRRGLYVKRFRNTPDLFLHEFDVANGLKSVSQRNTTTTPTQSLLMVNGDYTLARARKLAESLAGGEFATPAATLTHAFRLAWGRDPTASELADSLQFVGAAEGASQQPLDRDKLIDFCHVLLNSNEFLYVD